MRAAWHSGGSGVARSDNGGAYGWAQKRGGILRMYTPDSPASMSVPRGGDGLLAGPDVSMQSVVPDLATV